MNNFSDLRKYYFPKVKNPLVENILSNRWKYGKCLRKGHIEHYTYITGTRSYCGRCGAKTKYAPDYYSDWDTVYN